MEAQGISIDAQKKALWPEKILVGLVALLIAHTIILGWAGLFFRGERHLILSLVFLVAGYAAIHKWKSSPSGRQFSWRADFLWPFWFFLLSMIWVIAVPLFTEGRIDLALEDAQSLLMLPMVSLILYATRGMKIDFLLQLVLYLTFILALCVTGIWLYLELFQGRFPDTTYNFIQTGILNNAIYINLLNGYQGYSRVSCINEVWLTLSIFLAPLVLRNKWLVILFEFILGCGIYVTYTRGIWLGALGAVLLCTAVNYGVMLAKRNEGIVHNWGSVLMGLFLAAATLTGVDEVYHHRISVISRIDMPSSAPSQSHSTYQPVSEGDPERVFQARLLLQKWRERPIIGFGYGAYIKGHIRDESHPYAYEMMPFTLLMKLGLLGFGMCVLAVFFLLISRTRGLTKSSDKLMFVGSTTSFFVAAQTNPYLYNFVGGTVLLVILMWWVQLGGKQGMYYIK